MGKEQNKTSSDSFFCNSKQSVDGGARGLAGSEFMVFGRMFARGGGQRRSNPQEDSFSCFRRTRAL